MKEYSDKDKLRIAHHSLDDLKNTIKRLEERLKDADKRHEALQLTSALCLGAKEKFTQTFLKLQQLRKGEIQ